MAKRPKPPVLRLADEEPARTILGTYVLSTVQDAGPRSPAAIIECIYDVVDEDGVVSLDGGVAVSNDPDEVGSRDADILRNICAGQNAVFLLHAKEQVKKAQKDIKIYSATRYLSGLLETYQRAVDLYLRWFHSVRLAPAPPPRNSDRILKTLVVRARVNAEIQKHPGRPMEENFNDVAEQLGDTFEATKGSYYRKLKTATNKVTTKVT